MSSRYGARALAHQQAVSAILAGLASDPNIAPALSKAFARMTMLKPAVIEISVGVVHPKDEGLIEWAPTATMSRKAAAEALRVARRDGLRIARVAAGYEISGALNPAWSYA